MPQRENLTSGHDKIDSNIYDFKSFISTTLFK